ncbi:hypothetical protein GRF29_44g1037238 [Pseudopithomyces chartarum]|uniref:Large ribosomal subunit protein uL15/eL18 domain-containing protein n=1 Tax=Pseudopithomyces chartarum TaxID=1892770 RepID=A0AAN6M288_9PLEO|nr:hypothetical protein GRF29_44g1037238 [Pseudopithomyces chartarum]
MVASKVRSPRIDEVTGDKIFPLRFMDSSEVFTKIALDFTLRFDDVLDPEKLRLSLERLVQIGNWHQIGARYRKNAKGKLELHIPQEYDSKKPAIMFSHDNRQESIRDNELTKRLPQHAKVSHPTIYDDNRNFTSLVTRPGRPTKLKEWTETDHPGLSIHVASFTDATLVTLSWSHVFFDALGRQSFLQAWLAVLDGRDDEVPEFTPYEEDPIVSIAEGGRPWEHIHYGHVLTGIWYVLFVICFIYEMVVYKKEAGRTIRFPGSWVDELRNRAMDELREKGVAEKDAFVSHGDVLLAFWCKTTLAAQHIRSGRPLHIINAMNVRGASEHVPLPDKSAYIGNAVLSATSLTDTAELYKLSVGEVAYLHRDRPKHITTSSFQSVTTMPPRLKALRLASSLVQRPTACSISIPFLAPVQQRSASILSSLSDTKGAYSKKIRKGRGPASGKGKTAGRGQKGQHAHGKVPAGFQGGQTPLSITKPERGRDKYNPFKVEMSPINLDRIQSWIDQGRLDPSRPITMKELNQSRCLHGVKRHGVKLLAKDADQLNSAIHIVVSRASAAAIARVEALGGSVTTRFYSPTSIKRVLSGLSHPVISLQADTNLIGKTAHYKPPHALKSILTTDVVENLKSAHANPDTPLEVKNEALRAVMAQVGASYKYRLPDATARKDIEYYRDPAHRGYLSHLVKEGESPSLFFKRPGEAKDRKSQAARREAAKASAENRLF